MIQNLNNLSDKELLKLLRGERMQSEAAFSEFYRRYAPAVHAYCSKVFNDRTQAEDIFQETIIRFYQKVDTNATVINIPGYLITIARNLCLNHKRDVVTTVQIDGMEIMTEQNQQYETTELLELITMSLDLIGFEYKEAFVLREWDGLPYNEIAEIIGTTIENAKSRVFRAKQKIKDILAPYMKELCK